MQQKKRYILCLCVLTAFSLAACSPRTAPSSQPQSSAVSQPPQSAAPSPAAKPSSAAAPSPSPSASPTQSSAYSQQDQETIEEDMRLFADHFGAQSFAAATQLKSEEVLSFCLASLYSQKDLNAYIFEEDGSDVLISSALLTEAASQRFGLEGFMYPASERYVQEKDAYRFTPGERGAAAGNYEVEGFQGAEDGTVTYTLIFPEDQRYLYTFFLKRQNGIPYLQLVSAHMVDEVIQ